MRIVIASSTFPPEGSNGGLATFYYELACALVKQGHEVLVVTLTDGESRTEWLEGISVRRFAFDVRRYANLQNLGFLPLASWSIPRAAELYRQSLAVIAEFDPDVVECVESGFEGLFFAVEHSRPLAVRCLCPQFHLLELGYGQHTTPVDAHLVRALEMFVLNEADILTAPSQNLAQIVGRHAGIPWEQISIIRNPLKPPAETDSRSPAGRDTGRPALLFVGRIEQLKGCDLLIDMLPRLVSEFPEVELTMVGSEPHTSGESESFADRLRMRLKEKDLTKHVRFMGNRPRRQIPDLIAAADICLFPSRYDSSPYACLEAMSHGAAVIASRVGGIPEYVEHGSTGWLVEPDNPDALVEAIVSLSADEDARREMGRRARQSVADMCEPAKIARESVELYEKARSDFVSVDGSSGNKMLIGEMIAALDAFCENDYRLTDLDRLLDNAYQVGARATWNEAYAAGELAARQRLQEGQHRSPSGRAIVGRALSLVKTMLKN